MTGGGGREKTDRGNQRLIIYWKGLAADTLSCKLFFPHLPICAIPYIPLFWEMEMSLSPYLPQGGKFLPFPVLQLLQNQHSRPTMRGIALSHTRT